MALASPRRHLADVAVNRRLQTSTQKNVEKNVDFELTAGVERSVDQGKDQDDDNVDAVTGTQCISVGVTAVIAMLMLM